ncbi:XRE family transcriptional regulator [Acidovorax sp. Root275]|uniref:helix-turn-helix domain-containing protein n=1 Tax=unclassified Acidovorax TaxID=2684926 RepID=UPI00070898FE|nr:MULTISPECIES: helix-turn-helix transcriptional regulator [unclassified Acidovorax]KRD15053.1 XRE family transcriptional regulator [Acidovorax sp. Root267]KRD54909.1 XRE family transcriptional regulator [Acidovorax sp. Root275]
MPSTAPLSTTQSTAQMVALGEQIRVRRKSLGLSATVTAEAAGISRVTLHRIEKGEPSVTMGAWCNAMAALGMAVQAHTASDDLARGAQAQDRSGWIPARVVLTDYPQLRALAWQVHGTDALSPAEALDIYERNARHLDLSAMSAEEQALLQALRLAFAHRPGSSPGHV